MNRKTLQKVIDELAKETPRIPYVLGILETLVETLPEENSKLPVLSREQVKQITEFGKTVPTPTVTDEGSAIEALAKAKMGKIDLSAISNG